MKQHNQGFSLIELMIGIAIFGIVIGGVYQAYQSQHSSYLIQEQVSGMQQNYRAGMMMIAKDLRQSHCFMGEEGNITVLDPTLQRGIRAFDNYDYRLTVAQSQNWVNGVNTGQGPDRLDIAFANIRTSAAIADAMPKSSASLFARDIDFGKFGVGDLVVISNGKNANVMEITHTNQVGGGKSYYQHNPGSNLTDVNQPSNPNFPDGGYKEGSIIFKMKMVSYTVDTVTNPRHPRLMVDLDGFTPLGPRQTWQPLAHNIEDLQFVYIFADDSEADYPSEDNSSAQSYGNVRAVRVSILARSDRPIPGYTPRTELDRDGNVIPADGYIRRWYETTVKLRNVGLHDIPPL